MIASRKANDEVASGSVRQPTALVLFGDGINCERETSAALALAGFSPKLVHVNALIENPEWLTRADLFALPGGFSFGDELGSGQVLAAKLQARLSASLTDFIAQRKPVIGICNGFQVLVKLGLLPWPGFQGQIALAANSGGQFQNRWVDLEAPQSRCIWTRGLNFPECQPLQMPIRHGEGRLVVQSGSNAAERMADEGLIALRYATDVNGSCERIAGICDSSGVVLGLMPHPEAACHDWLHPKRTPGSAQGRLLFKNAFEFVVNQTKGNSYDEGFARQ